MGNSSGRYAGSNDEPGTPYYGSDWGDCMA